MTSLIAGRALGGRAHPVLARCWDTKACSARRRWAGPSRIAYDDALRQRGYATSARLSPAVAKQLDKADLRNVSFWGHIDAGKTTLTEKVLYHANALSPPAADDVAASSSNAGPGKKSHARQLPGDVDSGSTVTDFLEAERQRGITIQSAAVGPFLWDTAQNSTAKNKTTDTSAGTPQSSRITLVDTPGHIDFTIEVERSLRVADGCVVLIDGVEGVENQTEGVWRIAQRYNVRSHIAFINKLDRTGASLARSIRSIAATGMHDYPVLLQLPIMAQDAKESATDEASLSGLVDLTSQPALAHFFAGKAGEDMMTMKLTDAVSRGLADPKLVDEAHRAREQLIDTTAGLDEELLSYVLSLDAEGDAAAPSGSVSTEQIRQAIRRLVSRGEILPVLCGSAHKGVGVQPVLDAITWYLPGPNEAGDFDAAASRDKLAGCVWAAKSQLQEGGRRIADAAPGARDNEPNDRTTNDASRVAISVDDGHMAALAFKVVWDKRRGPMTFVRVYSGTLTRACALFNTATKSKERLSKIFYAYADRLIETEKLEAGQIGVLIGLRDTRTGDTLVDQRQPVGAKDKAPWSQDVMTLSLRRVNVPPPVFSLSLEPLGKADEGKLREALDQLIRTDPSLHIDYGDTTGQSGSGGFGSAGASGGQMVLSGMGELHLEIAKDRLLNEFGGRAHVGNVRVSYRETAKRLVEDADEKDTRTVFDHVFDKDVMGTPLKAGCRITVRTLTSEEVASGNASRFDGNVLDVDLQGTSHGIGDGMDAKVPGPDNLEAMPADLMDEEAIRSAVQAGLLATLSRGPVSGSPMQGLYVRISNIKSFGPQVTSSKALSMMASDAMRTALKERGVTLMEPYMNVTVRCDEEHLGKVVGDLTSAQSGIVSGVEHEQDDALVGKDGRSLDSIYIPPAFVQGLHDSVDADLKASSRDGSGARQKCVITATAPLIRLVQYSSQLRALTRGSGTFEMAFGGFSVVSPERQKEVLVELGRA